MRKALLLIVTLLCTYSVSSQKYVHVVECDSIPEGGQTIFALSADRILPQITPSSNLEGELELSIKKDEKEINEDKYYIYVSSFNDTIQVIKELLNLEGDNRMLCIPVTSHSSTPSTSNFLDERESVSVQVYALYMIWGLFFDYEYNAAYPVLMEHPLRGKQATLAAVSGKSVEEKAFALYRKWLKNGKGKTERLRKNDPLEGSNVKWKH